MRHLLAILTALLASISTNCAAQDSRFFAPADSNLPFSSAVRAGDFIFLSGQIGAIPDGKNSATIADQTKSAMERLRASLAMADAEFDDVVKCTVMLADMSQWEAFNEVYVTYFKPDRLPARSAFGTNGLARGAGVEVECIAYKPLASGR